MPLESLGAYRALCDRSLFYFIRICSSANKPFIEKFLNIPKSIWKPMLDFAQDSTKLRKGYGMPRNWLKSSNLTEWKVMWKWLQRPGIRQFIATEKEKKGTEWLTFIKRQLLHNPKLRQLYPDRLSELTKAWTKDKRWSSTMLDLPGGGHAEPSITIVGIGSAAQGGHYDVIYLDDLIGDAAIDSILVMDDARKWFDNVNELLLQADWQMPGASEVNLIGSPWGAGDLYDYAKTEYPEYDWRIVPALKDTNLEDTDKIKWIQNPDVEHGESNWPERNSSEYYKTMQANPQKQIIFWSQHQCNPRMASGLNKFDIKWLRYYRWVEEDGVKYIVCEKDDGTDGERFKFAEVPLYAMIDPGGFAETKSIKRGSRNAIIIGGQPRNSLKKFITYAWAGRLKKPSMFLDEVFKAHEEQKPRLWQIEVIGAQQYIYKDILEARTQRNVGSLKISPLPPDVKRDAKDHNIQGLINPMANGEIYLHRSMRDLVVEVQNYPHGLSVDLIDMMGKLNHYRWSRRERESMDVIRERESDQYQEMGRSPTTGY